MERRYMYGELVNSDGRPGFELEPPCLPEDEQKAMQREQILTIEEILAELRCHFEDRFGESVS